MFFQCVFLSVLFYYLFFSQLKDRVDGLFACRLPLLLYSFVSIPPICVPSSSSDCFFLFFHVSRKKGRCKSKLLHRSNTTSVVVLPVARPQPLLYSPSIVRIKKDDNVSQLRIGISGYGTNTPTPTHRP